MKKYFLPILVAAAILTNQLYAQCTVDGLAIQLKSATFINGQCQVIFDFSWNQDVNGGNKFAYIHFWKSSQYPDLLKNELAYTNSSDFPDTTDLADALATIVIDENGSATPVIGTVYHPQSAVPVLSSGLQVVKKAINSTWERMTIKDISLTIPNCTGTGLTGDMWASQAANGSNVHCVSSNVSVIIGNPRVNGLMFCLSPRNYSAEITNLSADTITCIYNLYIDEGDGVYEPVLHDEKVFTSSSIVLAPGATYNSGQLDYPKAGIKPYSERSLWIEVNTTGYPNSSIDFVPNSCIGLPVQFGLFTAGREQEIVKLNWETLSEFDNSVFEVQRLTANSRFRVIGTVPTKAMAGNSQERLMYEFEDRNPYAGVSIYRIRQLDINGKFSFSESRAVEGLNQENLVHVYPNPTTNGEVYLLFADPARKYDLALFDQQGRLVQQWRSFNGKRLNLGSIKSGTYLLRVYDPAARASGNVKLVVMGEW